MKKIEFRLTEIGLMALHPEPYATAEEAEAARRKLEVADALPGTDNYQIVKLEYDDPVELVRIKAEVRAKAEAQKTASDPVAHARAIANAEAALKALRAVKAVTPAAKE